jgi:hypothetical protein
MQQQPIFICAIAGFFFSKNFIDFMAAKSNFIRLQFSAPLRRPLSVLQLFFFTRHYARALCK